MTRQYSTIFLLALLLTGYIKQTLAEEAVWIAGWQQTSEMNTARAGAAVLQVNGVIYAIGGVDGRNFLSTSEFSQIRADGSLGPWQRSAVLNDARGFFDAVEHNGYIYVAGGGKGDNGKVLLRSVERSRISANGELEGWITERHGLKYPRRCVKLFIANNRIYALGGFGGALLDSVESAPINDDGSLGPWRVEANPLTMTRYINSVKSLNGFTYVIGGHAEREGVGLTEVEFTRPTIEDDLVWQKTVTMQMPRYALSSVVHGHQLYAIGGLNGAVYSDKIELTQQLSDGELTSWRYTTPLSSVRANFGSVVYNDRIYIIGGTNRDGYYKSAEY
ncbi:MAG TPA: kelch repeat-containing protein, partial [Chromatiales bacterium]|nr:kelch repeat-containing protein [Chromatiales bacterium]